MRLFTRILIPVAFALLAIGIATPAQAFQLEYFDWYPSLQGCLNTGESGLDSGTWYGYQCRTTAFHHTELWVSFSP